ncbi:MAG: aldo/keto reductase, partial [SAR324 cluster bacterium]|nr:aldo/keto reductase [SAR324 cluster bacterium]
AIGRSPAQVALNWVLRQPGQFIPILGVRTESQLRENLRCLAFTLGDDHLRQLDEASRIDLGFPLDYLVNPPPEIMDVRWGGTQRLLDNHHPGVPLPRK